MEYGSPALRLVVSQLLEWAALGRARLRAGGDAAIRELHLELTHRCDMRCRMCHHWPLPLRQPGAPAQEPGLSDIREWVEASELFSGLRFVTLTGGEPWLHPQCVDIAVFLRQRFPGAALGVLTHMGDADMLKDRLTELDGRGVRDLWLGTSLDGIGPGHDRIRGRRGAFQGLVRSLDMLRADFPAVRVTVNFTITPDNISGLEPAYVFAQQRGLGFGAQFVVRHEGFASPAVYRWSPQAYKDAADAIARVMEAVSIKHKALERLLSGPAAESQWLWSQLLYWHYLREYRGASPWTGACRAGSRYAMINPEGQLFFCPVRKHQPAGDVRRDTFDRVWRSRRARELRRTISGCSCGCWLNCIAYPLLDSVLEAAWQAQSGSRPEAHRA